jgi:phosphopantetheinyl transferase (holo-ACP synthase)
MMVLGNDIVDLNNPFAIRKGSHTRYFSKILSGPERDWLVRSDNPDLHLWFLWSAKESAYKAACKLGLKPGFRPKELLVTPPKTGLSGGDSVETEVSCPRGTFFIRSILDPAHSYIHSIACNQPELEKAVYGVCEKPNEADAGTEFTHAFALREFTRLFPRDFPQLAIRKKEGIPYFEVAGGRLATELSLSHDGPFAAFAFSPAIQTHES